MSLNVFGLIDVVGQALSVQQARLEVVSSNLANAQTTRTPEGGPYRRRDVMLAETLPRDGFGAILGDSFSSPVRSVRVSGVRRDPAEPRLVYDPSHPDADAQGYVAYPNINSVEEMVNLITVMRSYQANIAAFSALRDMAMRTLNIGKGT